MNKGKVIQVIGSVFDAKFAPEQVPAVYNAIEVQGNFGKSQIVHQASPQAADLEPQLVAAGSILPLQIAHPFQRQDDDVGAALGDLLFTADF